MTKHKYPSPDIIEVNESDLKHIIEKLKKGLKKKFSFPSLLILAPAWLPVFQQITFKEMSGLSGDTIRGLYTAIVVISTLFILPGIIYSLTHILGFFYQHFNWSWVESFYYKEFINEHDTNSDRIIQGIKKRCIN